MSRCLLGNHCFTLNVVRLQPCDTVSIVLDLQEELDEDVELITSKSFTVFVAKQIGQQFSLELVRNCKDCNGLPAFQLLPLYEIVLSLFYIFVSHITFYEMHAAA